MSGIAGTRWPVREGVAAGVLVLLGQVLLQVVGRLSAGSVRYPGPWVPTITGDSGVYLSAAERLPELPAHHATKVLYLLLLRIDAALGLAGWGVLAVQVGLLWAAAFVLIRYVSPRWGARAGLLSAAALTMNPNVAQWTKTIFTESVFIPMTVILTILLAGSIRHPEKRLGALTIALASAFVRPNGIGSLLGTTAVLSASLRRARLAVFAVSTAAIAAAVVLSPAFQSPGGQENTLAARTYEGLVIWVDPDFVRVDMPDPDDPTDLTNRAVVSYALQHPVAVLGLGGRRVLAELTQVRAHYPATVNAVIVVQMVGFYLLAAIGLGRSRNDPVTRSIVAVSAGLLLVIAGTWAIAEGRFGWAMLATWSPWIGIGLDTVWGWVRGVRSQRSWRQGPLMRS